VQPGFSQSWHSRERRTAVSAVRGASADPGAGGGDHALAHGGGIAAQVEVLPLAPRREPLQERLAQAQLGPPDVPPVLEREALQRGRGGGLHADDVVLEALVVHPVQVVDDLLGLLLFPPVVLLGLVGGPEPVRPDIALAGREHRHGMHARRRQGGVLQGGNEDAVVPRVEILDVVDEQLDGLRPLGDGLRLHPQIEEKQVQGRLELLGPGHPLGRDVPGLDELPVQVPHGGVGHHAVRPDLGAVPQAHPAGPPVLDEDLVHHVPVQDLSAVLLQGRFQLVGEHLRGSLRVAGAAQVGVHEHGGGDDGRDLLHGAAGEEGDEIVEEADQLGVPDVLLHHLRGGDEHLPRHFQGSHGIPQEGLQLLLPRHLRGRGHHLLLEHVVDVEVLHLLVHGPKALLLAGEHGGHLVQVPVHVAPERDGLAVHVEPVDGLVADQPDLFLELVHDETVRGEALLAAAEEDRRAHVEGDAVAADGRAAAPRQVVLLQHQDPDPFLGQQRGRGQAPDPRAHHHHVVSVLQDAVIEQTHHSRPPSAGLGGPVFRFVFEYSEFRILFNS